MITRTIVGDVSDAFANLYVKYNPDLVVTAFHASEKHLQMPFWRLFFLLRWKIDRTLGTWSMGIAGQWQT